MGYQLYKRYFPTIYGKLTQPIICISIMLVFVIKPVFSAQAASTISERVIHSDSIDALCSTNKFVYTGSFDGHIKRTTMDSVEEIGAHKDWVRSLICINNDIISASNDGRIIIWDDSSISKQVHAHNWWITDMAFYKNTIISVSLDETVKMWRYPDLEKVYAHKIYGSKKHQTVTVCQNRLFVGSTWGISVMDLTTRRWIFQNKSFEPFNVFLSSTSSKNDVYFGDNNGKVYRFDASRSELTSTSQVSTAAIKAICYYQGTLLVGDDKGNIIAMDAKSLVNSKVLVSYPQAVRAILVRDDIAFAGFDGGILRAIRID